MYQMRLLKHSLCTLLLASFLVTTTSTNALADNAACCVFMSYDTLTTIRTQIASKQAADNTRAAYAQLLADADQALRKPRFSVTDKSMVPASGDKHDYMSIAVYTWPNPAKKDGLPWIHKDGQINPDTKNDNTDAARFATLTQTVQVLALAGFFSGDDKYSQHAAALLRMWFITPETRMNPNLKYAQGIPGVTNGRPEGILDGRYLATRVIDSVLLLQQSSAWSKEDDNAMRAWMDTYFTWLTTSKAGKNAGARKNNHGTWYKVQAAGIARYLGKNDKARELLASTKKLVDGQLAASGAQPLELSRTRSFHYSIFNLQPLVMLAVLAKHDDIDLWHYTTPKGASILKALNYMAPYADPAKKWPHKTRDRTSVELIPLLILADNNLKTRKYKTLITSAQFNKVSPKDIDPNMGTVKTALRESWLLRLPGFVRH